MTQMVFGDRVQGVRSRNTGTVSCAHVPHIHYTLRPSKFGWFCFLLAKDWALPQGRCNW